MINREDTRILEKMKQDKEIAYLDSGKTERIIIMDRGEYDHKMKEALVKMVAESVMKDPNEVLKEKRIVLIKNGICLDNKGPRIYNFVPNIPCIFGRVKEPLTKTNKQMYRKPLDTP